MLPQSITPTDICIRSATEQDASVLHEFICLLEESALDADAFNTIFRRNLLNPDVHYLVAERVDTILGFISCHVQYLLHHVGKVGEIQELFVRPEVRSQGIGQKLIVALNKLAQQENFVNLEVTTNKKRFDTLRFYERELFSRTHVKLVKPIRS